MRCNVGGSLARAVQFLDSAWLYSTAWDAALPGPLMYIGAGRAITSKSGVTQAPPQAMPQSLAGHEQPLPTCSSAQRKRSV